MKSNLLEIAALVLSVSTFITFACGCSSSQERSSPEKATHPRVLQGPWTYPEDGVVVNQRRDTCPEGLHRTRRGVCCCPGDLACIDRGKERELRLCGGDIKPMGCEDAPVKQPHAKEACTITTNKPCSLPKRAVEETFEEQKGGLLACFEPNNLGEVFVAGCVDARGRTLHPSVHVKRNAHAAESEALASCIHARINDFRFPESQLGSSFFHIRFRLRGDELGFSSDPLRWGM